jgi:hypothetical protein
MKIPVRQVREMADLERGNSMPLHNPMSIHSSFYGYHGHFFSQAANWLDTRASFV